MNIVKKIKSLADEANKLTNKAVDTVNKAWHEKK